MPTPDSQSGVLVVGYGNPLREDDGFGWQVVEALRVRGSSATLVTAFQLTPDLAEAVSRAEQVVFVDARADGEPGLTVTSLRPSADDTPMTHGLAPELLLHYAERLFGRAPRASLVSVRGERFGFAPELSADRAALVPEAVGCIERLADTPARPGGTGTIGQRRVSSETVGPHSRRSPG